MILLSVSWRILKKYTHLGNDHFLVLVLISSYLIIVLQFPSTTVNADDKQFRTVVTVRMLSVYQ